MSIEAKLPNNCTFKQYFEIFVCFCFWWSLNKNLHFIMGLSTQIQTLAYTDTGSFRPRSSPIHNQRSCSWLCHSISQMEIYLLSSPKYTSYILPHVPFESKSALWCISILVSIKPQNCSSTSFFLNKIQNYLCNCSNGVPESHLWVSVRLSSPI